MDTEYPPFAIGITTEEGLKRRAAERARKKKKDAVRKRWQVIPTQIPFDIHPHWSIVPRMAPGVELFLYHAGRSCTTVLRAIRRKRESLKRYGNHDIIKTQYTVTLQMLADCYRTAIKNQRLLNAFGALARRWLLARMRWGNEEDLLTGDVPKNPIVLVDWKNRTKYLFEPRTIMKDMVERLLTPTCILFPKPLCPRNPYTNLPMTPQQFYSIVKQLRAQGQAHWALEALYSSHYSLEQFSSEMYHKIRRVILRRVCSDPKNADGNEILLDYIESEYEANSIHFPSSMFVLAMKHIPTHPYICNWRSLYYRNEIMRMDHAKPPQALVDRIEMESERLCNQNSRMTDAILDVIKKEEDQTAEAESESETEAEVEVEVETQYDPARQMTFIYTYTYRHVYSPMTWTPMTLTPMTLTPMTLTMPVDTGDYTTHDMFNIDTTLFSLGDDEGAGSDSS